MKHLSIITAILFSSFFVSAQNLIPNPSLEEYSECPDNFGAINNHVDHWLRIRAYPTYFHSCTDNPLIGWDNTYGYKVPRTGEGYSGVTTYSINESTGNAREYLGVELEEPLEIGETYWLTFYGSIAIDEDQGTDYATNNIGCLLMVNNYLSSNALGPIPNFSHYSASEVQTDSTGWTPFSFSFVADSSYQFIAFGNFYEDNQTEFIAINAVELSGVAYYYLDDFCLTADPEGCELTNSLKEQNETSLTLYPNPTEELLEVSSQQQISTISIFDAFGRKVREVEVNSAKGHFVDVRDLPGGMYILEVEFSNMIKERKKFVRK